MHNPHNINFPHIDFKSVGSKKPLSFNFTLHELAVHSYCGEVQTGSCEFWEGPCANLPTQRPESTQPMGTLTSRHGNDGLPRSFQAKAAKPGTFIFLAEALSTVHDRPVISVTQRICEPSHDGCISSSFGSAWYIATVPAMGCLYGRHVDTYGTGWVHESRAHSADWACIC